jgi:hypothetical protein
MDSGKPGIRIIALENVNCRNYPFMKAEMD